MSARRKRGLRLWGGLVAAFAAAALLLAPGAFAATEFGDACQGNEESSEVTLFEFSAPGNPLPTAAPVSGVLTKWTVNVVPSVPISFSVHLRVLRLNETAKTAFVVAAADGTAGPSPISNPTRIPIQAGDRLGLFGDSVVETVVCETASEVAHLGAFAGGGAVGASFPYMDGSSNARIPLVGTIEPDADGDGYGDETQDLCPQSAAFQTACPVVKIDSFVQSGPGSVTVFLIANEKAKVTVKGNVKLSGGGKAKLSAKKTVPPGKIAKLKIAFPAKLKQALSDLPAGGKLALKLTASAPNVVGKATTKKLTAQLAG